MRIRIKYADERTRAVLNEVWMDPSTGEVEHCSDSSRPPIREKGGPTSKLQKADTNLYQMIGIAKRFKT